MADHLGISMADVFAAERLIWVEGPTEELCFPFLYQMSKNEHLPRGTVFTSVIATGDFTSKKRDRALIYQIYQRLSQASAPLMRSVSFSFDSENLTDAEKEDMVRESKGMMHFLPRRHIEGYLIDPTSIANFILNKDPASEGTVDSSRVEALLMKLSAEKFKVKEWSSNLKDPIWASKVDAANLISDVCAELSEGRCTFGKKNDTLHLLKLIEQVCPECLNELAEYVVMLANSVGTESKHPG
jgi:hypothetical protein